jgi:acetoacetyl-CoA synthetase
MTKKLWEADLNQKKNSNLFAFENYISKKFNKKFNNDFQKILDWSIKNSSDFWDSFWDFTKIDGIKGIKKLKDLKYFIKICFYLEAS